MRFQISHLRDRSDMNRRHLLPFANGRVRSVNRRSYLLGATCGPDHITNIHELM